MAKPFFSVFQKEYLSPNSHGQPDEVWETIPVTFSFFFSFFLFGFSVTLRRKYLEYVKILTSTMSHPFCVLSLLTKFGTQAILVPLQIIFPQSMVVSWLRVG